MKEIPEDDLPVAAGDEIISDSRCFVCGLANPGGLQVRFYRRHKGEAVATCEPDDTFMGYDGLLHGGVAASLLDEIMIKAVLAAGKLVVTGRMAVNYVRPITLGGPMRLEGRIVSVRGRLYKTEGCLFRDAKEPLATATGTYVEMTGETKDRMLAGLRRQRAV